VAEYVLHRHVARFPSQAQHTLICVLTDGFPSSQAFEEISSALKASDQDRKEAIKNAAAIFAFTLKNDAGKEESWFIDLKQTGTVGKGLAPEGKKPDGMAEHDSYT